MNALNCPLTNAQVELLKILDTDLADNDIRELKALLSRFIAGKAVEAADKIWDERGLTDNDMDHLLGNKVSCGLLTS